MKKAMPKSVGGSRPGAGRPATGRDPSRTFRASDGLIANVDAWAAAQEAPLGRSEAIRRLVEIGLAHADQSGPKLLSTANDVAKRAAEMAANVIEKKLQADTPPEEKAVAGTERG